MKSIELIVPCYNEEKCISLFYDRICEVFSSDVYKDYEFIITYVDDGSKDNTLGEIKKVVERADKGRVQYIALSRNFGKEAAMYAGLSKCSGDYICVLDADLQHPPELMEQMLYAINEDGYDCASAMRVSRKGEPFFRKAFSWAFCILINKLTVMDLVPGATDYRLMKRNVAEAIVAMPERERFTKGIYSWIGFKNKWIEYKDVERVAGETTWSFKGLVKYAYSGFLAFATTPLRGVVYLGMLVVIGAIIAAAYVYILASTNGTSGNGYATIMIVMLLLNGVIITIIGMIGEYMARIYMEVKNRPIYFARETNIDNTPKDDSIRDTNIECSSLSDKR